jgi:hypothetical protein
MLYRIKPEDMETIHLADAAQVLQQIRERHLGAQILLKLDAEGAEFGIVDRLTETGAIKEIAEAAIEWHVAPGEDYLVSKLRAAGFQKNARLLELGIGMIDACDRIFDGLFWQDVCARWLWHPQ